MAGAIIGAALSVGSSIYSGIANRNAQKKRERAIEAQQKENQAWYDRKYNEDPTKRADTMRLLTQMQEQIKNRNKAAKGRQAVMGGTEDSTTAVKEANNKTLADTTSQIVAANEQRKDNIEQQYLARKQSLNDQKNGLEAEKATNTANAVAGVAGTAANIATVLDSGKTSKMTASRPDVATVSSADMAKLDTKVGATNQYRVADDLTQMVGSNAPVKKV